jgi:hypothetical protein
MIKVPFHSCGKGHENTIMFTSNMNPFFFYYPKHALELTEINLKDVMGIRKYLCLREKKFRFIRAIGEIHTKKSKTVPKLECFYHCICSSECTAYLIENEYGLIKLCYDYRANKNKEAVGYATSFEDFWFKEFSKNNEKYAFRNVAIGNGELLLIPENKLRFLSVFNNQFNRGALVDLLSKEDVCFGFDTNPNLVTVEILINKNFILTTQNTQCYVSKDPNGSGKLLKSVRYLCTGLDHLEEQYGKSACEFYKMTRNTCNPKKIKATDVLVFPWLRGAPFKFILEYISVDGMTKTRRVVIKTGNFLSINN